MRNSENLRDEEKEMNQGINEDVLCVLTLDDRGRVKLSYRDIPKDGEEFVLQVSKLCKSELSITEILRYLSQSSTPDSWAGNYRYCSELRDAFVEFEVDKVSFCQRITDLYREELEKFRESQCSETLDAEILRLKSIITRTVSKWCRAYNIKRIYSECENDADVLAFSHRESGWSNPKCNLTEDFNFEVKSNFGYGQSSYFFVKITFKGFDILPFSEWISYRYARTSEIVRYSESYRLENEEWLMAMKFARDACNLALIDEELFVQEYVVDECERLVAGLEKILSESRIDLYQRYSEEMYRVDNKGKRLLDFRGERVSGALDFMKSIVQLGKIADVADFVKRIEKCNQQILPVLKSEESQLRVRVDQLRDSKSKHELLYEEMLAKKEIYDNQKKEAEFRDDKSGEKATTLKLNEPGKALSGDVSEYKNFIERFLKVQSDCQKIRAEFFIQNELLEKIKGYVSKIETYFSVSDRILVPDPD